MGTEVVSSGGSSLTRKPPLLCLSAVPRDDPNVAARLGEKTNSRPTDADHRIDVDTPSLGKLALISVDYPFPRRQGSPAGDGESVGTDATYRTIRDVNQSDKAHGSSAEGAGPATKSKLIHCVWLFGAERKTGN